jgi:hypothetical protein
MELECHQQISGDGVCIILYNSREKNRQVILRKEFLGDTVWVLLSNISKEMTVSCAKSCCSVHKTSNARALAVVEVKAELDCDVLHYTFG